MDDKLREMLGVIEHVVYRNEKNGYTILDFAVGEELVTVVGNLPFVSAGEELRVLGRWVNHPTFGEQFKAETFERKKPKTTAAILRYLSSGAIKGIGPAMAARMVQTFGENTLEVMEKEPERLCVIKGITPAKAEKIQQEFVRMHGIKELMVYLGKYGITPEEAIRIWKVFGSTASEQIQEDPFCLCQAEVGIDFVRADGIAEAFSRPQNDIRRIQAGLRYVLEHNTQNGHTCLPMDKLVFATAQMLGVSPGFTQECLEDMLDSQSLLQGTLDDREYIFIPRFFHAERTIAEHLHRMLRFPPQAVIGIEKNIEAIENRLGIRYAEKQKQAIREALQKGILILTGGPGTGKTTTLNAIILLLEESGEKVFLAAPTGRAAKRMSEVTGKEAKTIHRLLQVEWNDQDLPVFAKNEKHPLECDAVVLDELSMVDILLFENVLRAMPLGCRLILVGDCDQLPSVGAGNVLADLIRCQEFPVVQLNEIFRQSMESAIVTNAHRIVSGQLPDLKQKNSDFFFLPSPNPRSIAKTIVDLCTRRLPASFSYTIWSDIQVLCPGRKGELGSIEINRRLQDAVNPPDPAKKEWKRDALFFREGDKVMQVKNNYHLPWNRSDGTGGEGVYNGILVSCWRSIKRLEP